MRRSLVVLILSFCVSAQPAKNIANYDLTARLDPKSKSVDGREILTWTNDSQDAVPELRFHVYMNAFKNLRSTFMRESGGSLRGDRMDKESWGYIEIKRMRIPGGVDLTPLIQYLAPDDGNKDDQTVIRVPLPKPLGPGEQIRVETDFHTKFPHVYARAGYHGDFYLAGQWFPKVGVWERAGARYATKGQWNCHQYHSTSEFYADFGKYDVKLTVPSAFVVGATGVEQNRRQNPDGTTTYSYYQESVHDFAWTAQPTYRRFERRFEADREVSPVELTDLTRKLGISHDEARLQDVRMILLLQPEHEAQKERHFRALANAIKYFGLWYGRYPHQTITLVDPPAGGGGAGGMEYPTFITGGTRWITGKNDGDPEEVVVHEFGHQYWQGMVASNEFEEAWLDEGFNDYATGKVLYKAYGPVNVPISVVFPLSRLMTLFTVTPTEVDRAAYLAGAKTDSLFRRAWEYQSETSYALNSYMRTGVMLQTLERTLGEDVMARVMRAYFQRFKFTHPAAPDFINVVNTVSGRDMEWFFKQFLYGSDVADYAVASVSSRRERAAIGVFDAGPGMKTVTEKDAAKEDEQNKKAKKETFRTKVTIRREGEVVYPVDIVVKFENGETERRQWDGAYRWVRYEFMKTAKAASVEVDPDRKLVADADWSNNSWVDKPQMSASAKWSSTLLFWVQQVLQTASLLG